MDVTAVHNKTIIWYSFVTVKFKLHLFRFTTNLQRMHNNPQQTYNNPSMTIYNNQKPIHNKSNKWNLSLRPHFRNLLLCVCYAYAELAVSVVFLAQNLT